MKKRTALIIGGCVVVLGALTAIILKQTEVLSKLAGRANKNEVEPYDGFISDCYDDEE